MSAKQNKEIEHRYIKAFEQGNVDLIADFLTPDYIYHGLGGREVKGIVDMKQFATFFHKGFPDIRFTFEDMVAEGDIVMYRYTMRGTHAPSGKKMSIMGFMQDRFKSGKLVESWEVLDRNELYQQIGAPPP